MLVGLDEPGAAAASAAAGHGVAASVGVATEVACAAASGEQDVVVEVATPGSGFGCYPHLAISRDTSACRGAADILVEDARISSDCPQGR